MFPGEVVKAETDADTIMVLLGESTSGENEEKRHIMSGLLNVNTRERLNGKARLMCRPETIRVYQQVRQFEHSNVLEGKVAHTSFVGGQWRTLIALDDLQSAPVLAFPDFQPQIEQHLWLEFPPEHCQVIPE